MIVKKCQFFFVLNSSMDLNLGPCMPMEINIECFVLALTNYYNHDSKGSFISQQYIIISILASPSIFFFFMDDFQ